MLKRYFVVPLYFVFAALLAAPSAAASGAAGASGKHCVTALESGETTCYASFAEAVSHLSGGKVQDISSPRELTDAVVDRIDAGAASVTVGVLFDDRDFRGDTQIFSGPGACVTSRGVDYQANIPLRFNDRTTSFQGFSRCLVEIYEHTNWAGTWEGPYRSKASVDTFLNNKASSVKFW